jgi:hypothetical protein
LAYLIGADAARTGATDSPERLTLEELTVQRPNVVDAAGKARIVVSSPERFPNPVVAGKEYPRSIKPAGLVFYKSNGDAAHLPQIGAEIRERVMRELTPEQRTALERILSAGPPPAHADRHEAYSRPLQGVTADFVIRRGQEPDQREAAALER